MRRLCCYLGVGLLLAGCGGESHQDLRAWMNEQGKGAKGKLDPLPQVKPYEPFAYNAFDLPDPFKPRKIEPIKGAGNLAPDLNRRKEPLEAFPLESLQMVGTLQKGRSTFALIRTTDRDVYQVKLGNYRAELRRHYRDMGQRSPAQGARAGRRRRLDRTVEHAAACGSGRSATAQAIDQRQERRR
jgi:type IV pilus assembly protein PilP